jgi:hypothetical protein
MIGLTHCQQYECVMNTLKNNCFKLTFCPVCLRKVTTYYGFDGEKRLEILTDHFKLLKDEFEDQFSEQYHYHSLVTTTLN